MKKSRFKLEEVTDRRKGTTLSVTGVTIMMSVGNQDYKPTNTN